MKNKEHTDPNVSRWTALDSYQAFLTQVHVDVCVGAKNNVPKSDLQKAIKDLGKAIYNSVDWNSLITTK